MKKIIESYIDCVSKTGGAAIYTCSFAVICYGINYFFPALKASVAANVALALFGLPAGMYLFLLAILNLVFIPIIAATGAWEIIFRSKEILWRRINNPQTEDFDSTFTG